MGRYIDGKRACLTIVWLISLVGVGRCQTEVYHRGETYDSLQAGHDAYLDAEAARRAQIGRQMFIEQQIVLYSTPNYGYVRQPVGHVKIWTGPQSYIYKPVYASAAPEEPTAQPLPPARARPRPRFEKPIPPPPPPGRRSSAPPTTSEGVEL